MKKTIRNLTYIFFIVTTFTTLTLQARGFKNAYISFEMHDSWKCNLEQTEWICKSDNEQEAREAVIILTAKEKGATDLFPTYETHLNNPIVAVNKAGVEITSKMKYKANYQKINNQQWLDSMHQDSEVQNYFTRYLVTIKDNIAILVTFSAHNKLFAKHSDNFNKTIQSLRVVATRDLTKNPELAPLSQGDLLGGGNISGAMQAGELLEEEGMEGEKGFLQNEFFIGGILLLIAILAFVGLKIYQKNKNS